MTPDQAILFGVLGVLFILLLWGKYRYDLVAFACLIACVLFGVVSEKEAFSGFGHYATIIIALILIASKGLSNSGAIELLARYVVSATRSVTSHIAIMSTLAASLSAMMNNVGALALLMPIDLQASDKAKRSPALTLMPLSFASILGGLITLIGTPPNIIIASYKARLIEEAEKAGTATVMLGEPYSMFSFTPVGLIVALFGVIFITFIGWRLIPTERGEHNSAKELFQMDDYLAEVKVKDDSPLIGKRLHDVEALSIEKSDVLIVGVVRSGQRLPGMAMWQTIEKGDVLVVEANPKALEEFAGKMKIEFIGSETKDKRLVSPDMGFVEVVVPEGARIENRSAINLRLLYRHGVTLLGISRQGEKILDRVRRAEVKAGDILLLYGATERLGEITEWMGCLPLKERGLQVIQRDKAFLAAAIFACAILLASLQIIYLPIALSIVCILYVLLNIVPLRQLYTSVEWPVVVLLGALLPVGAALETTGSTQLIAHQLISVTEGAAPWVVLTILMIVTMTLSDVLNNVATVVVAAPIGLQLADKLHVSPDPFLMGVAVAASCAFLTPIGHKNNTLIMGPGGYKFADYWRMGLPLEILIIAVSVPAILFFWPL